jgi:hypothetical protein
MRSYEIHSAAVTSGEPCGCGCGLNSLTYVVTFQQADRYYLPMLDGLRRMALWQARELIQYSGQRNRSHGVIVNTETLQVVSPR